MSPNVPDPRLRWRRASTVRVCLALLFFGCAAKQEASYEVLVRVESEPGRPLAGAQIAFAGQVVGASDAQGRVALRLKGSPGDQLSLNATCPEGHRGQREPLMVVLRALTEKSRLPEYHLLCPPLTRSLVIAVRASNGPNLPLRHLGKEIARTDASGAAHALLKVTPGDTVIVKLDTSASEHQKLMPQNPELKLLVPERDELVLFDQAFSKPKPAAAPRVKREPVGPQRI